MNHHHHITIHFMFSIYSDKRIEGHWSRSQVKKHGCVCCLWMLLLFVCVCVCFFFPYTQIINSKYLAGHNKSRAKLHWSDYDLGSEKADMQKHEINSLVNSIHMWETIILRQTVCKVLTDWLTDWLTLNCCPGLLSTLIAPSLYYDVRLYSVACDIPVTLRHQHASTASPHRQSLSLLLLRWESLVMHCQ